MIKRLISRKLARLRHALRETAPGSVCVRARTGGSTLGERCRGIAGLDVFGNYIWKRSSAMR